jgi:hypothetical protein
MSGRLFNADGTIITSTAEMAENKAHQEALREVKRMTGIRLGKIEGLAAAFLDATKLKPEEAELVQTQDGNTFTWFFRKRQETVEEKK